MASKGNGEAVPALDFTKFQNVVDGKLVDTKEIRHTVNPSNLEQLPDVPVSTPEDVDAAVEAAQRAQESWADVPWTERQQAVKNFADALEAAAGDFAKMLTKEQGKPVSVFFLKNPPPFFFLFFFLRFDWK